MCAILIIYNYGQNMKVCVYNKSVSLFNRHRYRNSGLAMSCLAYGGELCCHGIYRTQWYSTTSGDQLQLGVTHVGDFSGMTVRACECA
jgi:hypothetical protein